ncbi:MAG: zinc-binding dehydrogenase [Vulcanimicrobiaceae bacterium]
MRAVQLLNYDGKPESLTVSDVSVPSPRSGEVLVRMYASPINPSDLAFVHGLYGFRKPLPALPGFEGSGTVVAAGRGILPQLLKGRRVACTVADANIASGTWAEYTVTSAQLCVPLLKQVDMDQAATMLVNPLMAWALIDEARRGRHRAVVQTAAAGALGKMVIRLARRFSIPVINVVRRADQVDLLREIGAEHVLDSSAPDFDAELRELCHTLGASIGFDAIAGEMSGRVLRAQPKGSRLLVYGDLSQTPAPIRSALLIFEGKCVRGLWLSEWMRHKNVLSQLRVANQVQRLLASDLKTEIQARFPLEEVSRGLEHYAAHMTAGKVLLMPRLAASNAG